MKVRKLIEQLAKCNWDAEVKMDLRKDVACIDTCDFGGAKIKNVKSISSFRHEGKPAVTINVRGI